MTVSTSHMPELPTFPMARTCPVDPPPPYSELRQQHPVAAVQLWDGNQAWLVTGWEEMRMLLGDGRVSSVRSMEGVPSAAPARKSASATDLSFIAMDEQQHLRLRKMLTKYFTVKRIEELRPRVQSIVDQHIDTMLSSGPPCDLVEVLAQQVPIHTICSVLGVPAEHHERVRQLDHLRNTLGSSSDEVARANDEMLALVDEVVGVKESEPGPDLISYVLEEQVATGALSREELVPMMRLLLSAGHETTASMIAVGVSVLLERDPGRLAELHLDPHLLRNTVEELLRFISVFHVSPNRVALEEIAIAGVTIAAGDGIILSPSGPNRDPRAFPDPDVFDVHRDAHHHVAFGFGPHQCLGQPLARLELQTVFRALSLRVPALRLAVPFDELEFSNYNLVNLARLPVTW